MDSKRAAKPKMIPIAKDPFSIINKMNEMFTFVFPEIPKLLPEGRVKKSLKKVINECIKYSEFHIVYIQSPWIVGFVTLYHILRRL